MKPLKLLPVDLITRREETAPGTSLSTLVDALAHELEPMFSRALPIPRQKARLTRIGGRCPVHGLLLEFDPWSPNEHQCLRCGRAYVAPEHHDWWAMGAQLYTAERAVHAAALFALRGEARHAELSRRILAEFAARYPQWPNSDNALGPTRPFFSTYLESIWLLNICHALDLLEAASAPLGGVAQDLRTHLIAPSAALIASYHEGTSNRQVWNEVAILAALRVLGDDDAFAHRLDVARQLPRLIEHGLLDDGTWYEGENYHLFAHRGLWYGVQLMRAAGRALPAVLANRYATGFITPFLGLLPDETLPSRRDSQYAVSIRQWRFAEWCELGYANRADAPLAGLLARLYDGSLRTHTQARSRSTADSERNDGPSALSRADLSWRALLAANATPVPSAQWAPASVLLPSQGLAVVRRERGRVYVALEGGHSGSGHGHPDRLALTLQTGEERWLQDPGTGSYVERTLHWYRSTLAHHAPLVNGASQPSGPARLLAFEDRGGTGWMRKRADIGAGVQATRTVVVCEGYLVDVLEWQGDSSAADDASITLPLCGDASWVSAADFRPVERAGAGGLEDGYEFLRDVECATIAASPTGAFDVRLEAVAVSAIGAHTNVAHAALHLASSVPCALIRARTPGAPGCGEEVRHAIELHGSKGRLVSVWHWQPTRTGVTDPDVIMPDDLLVVDHIVLNATIDSSPVARVTTSDGTTALHGAAPHGWHIELVARHARSSVDLEGLVPEPDPSDAHAHTAGQASERSILSLPYTGVLAEPHYLRTEQTWEEAGAPTATLSIRAHRHHLTIDLEMRTGTPVFPDPEGNVLDNERADTNADGVQWYWGEVGQPWTQAALCVPTASGLGMTRLVAGTWPLPAASWEPLADGAGWSARFDWLCAQLPGKPSELLAFNLVVNERPADRKRRRGQLVLTGRDAEPPLASAFSYLRGDRQNAARAVHLQLPDR